MSAPPLNWRDKTCAGLSLAIVGGFLVFFSYSISVGISKQAVYTGAVGYWLGIYMLFALLASLICIVLVLWMRLTREPRWKPHGVLLLCAWGITLLCYWAWHMVAQTQFAS